MVNIISIKKCYKKLVSADSEFRLEVENLNIAQGEFLGFVGRSGCGKSTLLDILSLASRPDTLESYQLSTGTNLIDLHEPIMSGNDKMMSAMRLHHFGYVLQWGGLIDCLNVAENVNLIPNALGLDALTAQSELVQALDMGAQFEKPIRSLSGGQRQRVSILRALATRAEVIVADEPTAAIDETMAEVVIQQFRDLARKTGATVILVSHDLDLVRSYCDRVIELRPEQDGPNAVVTRIDTE